MEEDKYLLYYNNMLIPINFTFLLHFYILHCIITNDYNKIM